MKKFLTTVLVLALAVTAMTGCAKPAEPKDTATTAKSEEDNDKAKVAGDPEKKAILVVSFGTSYNDTRAVTIDAIENDIAAAFPDYDVKRAFTSQIIINKLEKRDGLKIDNVAEAMEKLISEGYGTIICQPTHIMNGSEYDDMVAEVSPYADKFTTLKFGAPLLSAAEDYAKLTAILKESMPKLTDKEVLVFMGHGTSHPANSTYSALAYQLQLEGINNMFVGTVEGFPDLDTVMKQVKAYAPKKVYLTPLMVVAGDHANNDMAGDEESSWKTVFKAEGFEVEPILKGLGEYPNVRKLYVAHVEDAINSTTEEEKVED